MAKADPNKAISGKSNDIAYNPGITNSNNYIINTDNDHIWDNGFKYTNTTRSTPVCTYHSVDPTLREFNHETGEVTGMCLSCGQLVSWDRTRVPDQIIAWERCIAHLLNNSSSYGVPDFDMLSQIESEIDDLRKHVDDVENLIGIMRTRMLKTVGEA